MGPLGAQDRVGLLGHQLALGIDLKFAVAGQRRRAVGKLDLEEAFAFNGHVGVVAGVFQFARREIGGGRGLGDGKELRQIPGPAAGIKPACTAASESCCCL